MKNQHLGHLALLGIGAVVVLWYLTRQSASTASATPAAAPANTNPAGVPSYPSASATVQPIQLGNVILNEGQPLPSYMNYNTAKNAPASASVKQSCASCAATAACGLGVSQDPVAASSVPQHVADKMAAGAAYFGRKVS